MVISHAFQSRLVPKQKIAITLKWVSTNDIFRIRDVIALSSLRHKIIAAISGLE